MREAKKLNQIIKCIFLFSIFFQCGSPALLSKDTLISAHETFEANLKRVKDAPTGNDCVNTVWKICIDDFKHEFEQGKMSSISWGNRGKKDDQISKENNDRKYVDNFISFTKIGKNNFLLFQPYLKIPDDPSACLEREAIKIAKFTNPSDQQEYWGNLVFYLSSYTLILLMFTQNTDWDDARKNEQYKKIVEAFYESYSLAFKLISGIEFKKSDDNDDKKDFKTMCFSENEYSITLFEIPGVVKFVIPVGPVIWIMESLALLNIHPYTRIPATMENLCRGNLVVDAKDIVSVKSFNQNKFLLSFSLHCCDYVKKVITDIKKYCFFFDNDFDFYLKISLEKKKILDFDPLMAFKIQQEKKLLFKEFRRFFDLEKDKILVFDQFIKKKNDQFYFTPSDKFIKNEKGIFSFIGYHIDKSGDFDETFAHQLNLFKTHANLDFVFCVNAIISFLNTNKGVSIIPITFSKK